VADKSYEWKGPVPPPVEVRYPAAVRSVWYRVLFATVGGASLGFGTYAIAFNPESPFAWISFGVGVATATGNLIVGPRLAARFAFFCGRIDGAYRMVDAERRAQVTGDKARLLWDVTTDPTYPDEEDE